MTVVENFKNENNMDVLNILQKFGKYQIFQYILICLPSIFISMNNVNYVFVAGDVDYRCRESQCASESDNFSCNGSLQYNQRCIKPNLNTNILQVNTYDSVNHVDDCKEWIYANNDTIVSWLNLACKPWKTNFVGTIHNIGMILGMVIGGWASDAFGRKPTIIFAFVGTVVGCLKTIVPSYFLYISIELVESITSGVAFSSGMVLIIEISGNDKRVLSGVLYAYSVYFGEGLLAFVAMLVVHWRTIVYAICAPSILFLIYFKILQESPMWLVLHNKFEEAKDVMKLIAKINNLHIKNKDLCELNEGTLRQICNSEISVKNEGYIEAFKNKEILKRLLVASVGRFSVTFIYYGLVANSVWLPGNKYTNYILTAIMSFPGDLVALYFLNKFGRKMPLVYGYLVCGVACIASGYVPTAYSWLRLLLYLIGKLLVAACYTGIWTYTMELFPTSIRGSMFGVVTFTASAGSMLAPLTPALNTISPIFSSMFFGISAITSSMLILLTPETKDLPLSATIEDVMFALKDKNDKKDAKGIENPDFDHVVHL